MVSVLNARKVKNWECALNGFVGLLPAPSVLIDVPPPQSAPASSLGVIPSAFLLFTLVSTHHGLLVLCLSHPSTSLNARCRQRAYSLSTHRLAWTSAKIHQQVFPFLLQTSIFPVLHALARGVFPYCQSDGSCQTRHVWLSSGHPLLVIWGWNHWASPAKLCLRGRCPLDSSHASRLSLSLPWSCWCLSTKPLPPCVVGIHSLHLVCSTSFLSHILVIRLNPFSNGSQPKCHLRSLLLLSLSLHPTLLSILSLSNWQFFVAFATFSKVVNLLMWHHLNSISSFRTKESRD